MANASSLAAALVLAASAVIGGAAHAGSVSRQEPAGLCGDCIDPPPEYCAASPNGWLNKDANIYRIVCHGHPLFRT